MAIEWRRRLFGLLAVATAALLLALAGRAAAPLWAPLTWPFALLLVVLFAVTLPWTVIGFWNATIGLVLMRCRVDPVAAAFPDAADADLGPVAARTAILVCIRNESPSDVVHNIEPTLAGLARLGAARQFALFVLSDSDETDLIAHERRLFGDLAARWRDTLPVTYRRRSSNDGFKAGNIRDFCERFGTQYGFAIPLDADSTMPAEAMIRLVRLMERQPQLGIVQTLVIGFASSVAFTRLFQFGMRLGMRSYTLGSAWWQGDCGPYWGHNAIIRLAPFIAHCDLPTLPNGAAILSHDQIEAVLMRRAGYEVRVLPCEDLGFERNPPTLLEFIRRDQRWCQGNMQYCRLLALPGVKAVSRCQLLLAILMFIGAPAWAALTLAGVILALNPQPLIDGRALTGLFVATTAMAFMPKIATVIDVLCRGALRRAYGGAAVFVAGIAAETLFTMLLAPVMWCAHTIFLMRLAAGRPPAWPNQRRTGHGVSRAAALRLWPQTLLGIVSIACVLGARPGLWPYAFYFMGGLAAAMPLALVTAAPWLGAAMVRTGLCRLPEEAPLDEIVGDAVSVPAAR
jgi:membrane glycosyltransferase